METLVLTERKEHGGESALAIAQGAFYVLSGVWPILHLKSFEKVTGPKPEGWLVKTVGALVAVVGAGLLFAGLHRKRVSPELRIVAAGAAAALGAVDIVYPLKHRISKVYLLDAVPEAAIVIGWAIASWPRPMADTQPA